MKKNYTLIEVLVVIAILTVLVGLITPALGHAQAKGRTTECINNKKQIIAALRMYGNDHTSMIPYMVDVAGTKRPYSWILGGCGTGSYAKELVPKKILVCSSLKQKAPAADGTNAVGMVDIDFSTTDGWYDANKATVGRFVVADAARTASSKSVAYAIEKMKKPSEMVLLADSVSVDGSEKSAFWTFNPNGGKPKFNGAASEGSADARIATVHVGSTTVAYADGRAEAQTPKQLGESVLKLTKYYDDNFAPQDL